MYLPIKLNHVWGGVPKDLTRFIVPIKILKLTFTFFQKDFRALSTDSEILCNNKRFGVAIKIIFFDYVFKISIGDPENVGNKFTVSSC